MRDFLERLKEELGEMEGDQKKGATQETEEETVEEITTLGAAGIDFSRFAT